MPSPADRAPRGPGSGVPGTGGAPVAGVGERPEAAVARVVLAQLEALRAGDFEAAWELAAEGIRLRFPLEDFERMVREGYGPLIGWTACDVEGVDVQGEAALARVRVVAADGILYGARYQLILEEDEWRVSGVAMGPRITAAFSLNGKRAAR